MMELLNNVTINGINYRRMGTAYVPTAPGLILAPSVNDYGFAHMKYLQMAHPDDFARLQDSGLLQEYLARVGCMVKLFIEDREKYAPIPALTDPDFEEKFLKNNSVSHNATCKAENTYIFHGLHDDVLNSLRKVADYYAREEKPKAPTFDEWLKEHPNEANRIKWAKDQARDCYRKDMRKQPGKKLKYNEWLDMHPDVQSRIKSAEQWANDRYHMDKRLKKFKEMQAKPRRKEMN